MTPEQMQALEAAAARAAENGAAERRALLEAAAQAASPSAPPEGFFYNPQTGQMTSRETMRGYHQVELGRGEAAANTAAHGATLGTTDEAAWLAGRTHSPEMAHAMKESQRAKIEAARGKYPVQSFATEAAGAMAVPLTIAGGAPTLAGAAVGGAVTGWLYGAGEGEGGVADRAKSAVVPGVIGAAAAPAGVPIGKAVGWAVSKGRSGLAHVFSKPKYYSPAGGLTDEGRKALQQMGYDPARVNQAFADEFGVNLERGVSPQDAAAAADLEQFGIPAYRHNVSMSPEEFAAFERARKGGAGTIAERQVGQASDRQFKAMQGSIDRQASEMSGGVRADQVDAGMAVSARLDDLGKEAKAAASKAYRAADEAGMAVDPLTAQGVVQRITTRLADEEIDTTLDIFKNTRSYLSRLEKRGSGDKPVSLRLIDGMRKDINKALGKNLDPEDARALTIIKEEYDQWLDDVVTAKLFDGDDGMPALKEARHLFAQYMAKYGGKGKEAKFIQMLVDQEASPEEVSRALFGASELGRGKMTSNIATALKDRLGADSDEWNMLRQAAFRMLTQKPGTENPSNIIGAQWGPQRISERVLKFVNNPATRPLAEALFSPEELANMRKFGGALKRMVPPPGASNTSNTAIELSRMGQGAWRALAASLGFAGGGPGGAALAEGAARGGGVARSWLTGRSLTQGAQSTARTGGALQGAQAARGVASTTEERLNLP